MTCLGEVGGPLVAVERGPRAVESRLLADSDAILACAGQVPGGLAIPVRIVVPSRSLREHVISVLVRSRGRAVTGVVVETLHGLARDVLRRMGEPAPRGGDLFPILLERAAADEPLLRSELGALRDGYGTLVATVRDLLDAGFDGSQQEALDASLAGAADRATERELARGRAIARTGGRVVAAMEQLGVGREADMLRRAAELLDDDPERALPARAVLVHGFAEATGAATDLLLALARDRWARFFLDEPPDPADPGRGDLGVAYARRLRERLAVVCPVVASKQSASAASQPVQVFAAVSASAEVREVARRVRGLLDTGADPESVAVVARTLEPYQEAFYRHFHRLGVPFSCRGAIGLQGPDGSVSRGLFEVIRLAERAPLDAWLALAAHPPGVVADLRVGLRAAGAARLEDLESVDLSQALDRHGMLPLPVRQGFELAEEESGGEQGSGAARAPRRRLEGEVVRGVIRRAGRALTMLSAWPAAAPLARHLELLQALLTEALGWREETTGAGHVLAAARELELELPPELDLRREELAALLHGRLREAGRHRLGGMGGGVQVMAAIEARAWTAEHLFVLGLNRGVFPRVVQEDPLLPDSLREVLAAVLPEMPRKRTGYDEERYLFAQLVAASPRVTLSWRLGDESGRPAPVSPLVERLLVARGREAVVEVGELHSRPLSATGQACAADELATMVGLFGTREQLAGVLPVALAEAHGGTAPWTAMEALAVARLSVLDELDPDLRTASGQERSRELGPYFGFIGAPREAEDPRQVPAVTTIEAMASCPWRSFLERLLRLETTPDPGASLPDVDRRLVGDVVHRVLERVVREAGVEPTKDLTAATSRRPVRVPWPSAGRMRVIISDEALGCMRRAGISLPGVHTVLQARVWPFLEVARDTDWNGGAGTVEVVGVETRAEVCLAGAGEHRRISFRADRVDAAEGGLRLTDYKTGIPWLTQKQEKYRRRRLVKKIGEGEALQVAAYAAAGGGGSAVGRLLYLWPELDAEVERAVIVGSDDHEAMEQLAAAVRAVLDGWDLGSFFPRLTKPDRREAPATCGYCCVRQACLQGDSGARARLFNRMTRLLNDPDIHGGAEELAAMRIWGMATAGNGEEGDG